MVANARRKLYKNARCTLHTSSHTLAICPDHLLLLLLSVVSASSGLLERNGVYDDVFAWALATTPGPPTSASYPLLPVSNSDDHPECSTTVEVQGFRGLSGLGILPLRV